MAGYRPVRNPRGMGYRSIHTHNPTRAYVPDHLMARSQSSWAWPIRDYRLLQQPQPLSIHLITAGIKVHQLCAYYKGMAPHVTSPHLGIYLNVQGPEFDGKWSSGLMPMPYWSV